MKRNFTHLLFGRLLATTCLSILSVLIFVSADVALAGQILGEDAISGVNLICPIAELVLFLSSTVGFGASIHRSISLGARDREAADLSSSTGLWASLALGAVLCGIFPFSGCYLDWISVTGDIRQVALAYCESYWAVAAISPVYFLLSTLLCAEGAHRNCRTALIADITLKLGLSAPFARWMGVAGLPLATFVGLLAAVLIMASYLRNPNCTLVFSRGFSFRALFMGVRYSLLEQMYIFGDMLRMVALHAFVIWRFGDRFLPVASAFTSVLLLSYIMFAMVNATQPLIATYLGEGNLKRVRDAVFCGGFWTFTSGLALSLATLAYPEWVISLVGISDPELVSASRTAIRLCAAFLAPRFLCGYAESVYVYVGRFAVSAVMTALDSCIVSVALGVAFGLEFGTSGLWFGLSVSSTVVLVAVVSCVWFAYRDPCGLDCGKDEGRIHVFDLTLTKEAIVGISRRAMEILKSYELPYTTLTNASLMVEDVLLVVKERNPGRTVHAEVSLDVSNGVMLTIRDDGTAFDITDSNARITSLGAYLVSSVMDRMLYKTSIATLGVNRVCLRF